MTIFFQPSVTKAAVPVIVGVVYRLHLVRLVGQDGVEQHTIIVREVSSRSNKSLNDIFIKFVNKKEIRLKVLLITFYHSLNRDTCMCVYKMHFIDKIIYYLKEIKYHLFVLNTKNDTIISYDTITIYFVAVYCRQGLVYVKKKMLSQTAHFGENHHKIYVLS